MARPRNGPNRASTRPASVPKITAPEADIAATLMDTHAAARIWSSFQSRAYQRSDGEVSGFHTVTERESLNENTIMPPSEAPAMVLPW